MKNFKNRWNVNGMEEDEELSNEPYRFSTVRRKRQNQHSSTQFLKF